MSRTRRQLGTPELQPHAHRSERRGQHVAAAGAIRSGPGADGRHRHRRPEALRTAELGKPAARAERVQLPGRPLLLPREALREGRRAGRALPGQHGQSDLQPGYLLVPEPERLPAQRAEQLRRPHAGGAIRSLLALHALRLLRAGRVPRDAATDAQRRTALRVHDDAGRHLRARFIAAGSVRVAANRRAVVRESDVHEPFASRSARRGTSSAMARRPSAAVTASTSTRPTSRT